MPYQNDQQPEPTPEIGPGICQDIAARLAGNTLVSDVDPLAIFPQETENDLEKLEPRVEAWYNLISQMGELKAIPTFKIDPFNKAGLLYLRIEQYLMLLAHPSCTPELKAIYWADVVAAQNSQAEITPQVTITFTQAEYGEDKFEAVVSEVGKLPSYTHQGPWALGLKFCIQFYRVRRWECTGFRFVFPKGDPIHFESLEPIAAVVSGRLDDQANDLILEKSS